MMAIPIVMAITTTIMYNENNYHYNDYDVTKVTITIVTMVTKMTRQQEEKLLGSIFQL